MVSSGLLQAYIAVGISAVLPIYFGSHASVKTPKSVRKLLKEQKAREGTQTDNEDEDEDDFADVDRLTSQEAWLFPILGSCTLVTLFLAFKYLNKEMINLILSSYFALLGVAGLTRTATWMLKVCCPRRYYSSFPAWKITLSKKSEEYFMLSFISPEILLALLSLLASGYHFYSQNWQLSNAIGLSFAFNAISLMRIDSFRTGTILLAGLFLYDIFWVFYSSKAFGKSVMVSVATDFQAPIKLVYPKDGLAAFLHASAQGFTMLGLGDIVIPGIFISLALRFDYHLAVQKGLSRLQKKSDDPGDARSVLPRPSGRYPKPYFHAVMLSYVAGLATTVFVMHTFQAAQPALLYLSPACTLSVLIVALFKREVRTFWKHTEEDEEEETVEKQKSAAKKVTDQKSNGQHDSSAMELEGEGEAEASEVVAGFSAS